MKPKLTFKNNCLMQSAKLLPKNAISRLMGKMVSLKLPKPLVKAEISAFGKAFGIDFDEVKEPLSHFSSLQDFFVRELKGGKRPVERDPKALVSPCDGAWGQAGTIEDGTLLQIKGRPYRLAALLGDETLAQKLEGGQYATLYLSPRDYHRFHAPFAGRVTSATYLPGYLWPVNPWAVANVDELFCINERIAWVLQHDSDPDHMAVMVAVGATMVGKVHVEFDPSLSTNIASPLPDRRSYGLNARLFEKGEEMGRFEFGSTNVMITSPKFAKLQIESPSTAIKMGQRMGSLEC
jgi:phosphatidylserine decarboxylase